MNQMETLKISVPESIKKELKLRADKDNVTLSLYVQRLLSLALTGEEHKECTVKEAAIALGCSETMVKLLCESGRINAKKEYGRWAINQEDLDKIDGIQMPINRDKKKEEKTLPKMYKVADVAGYTGMKHETILGWIRNGKLKAKKVGNQYLVPEEDLMAFINQEDEPEDALDVEEMIPEGKLSTKEVASFLNKSNATILNWIREGRINATRRGNTFFIEHQDVIKLIHEI